MEPIPFIDLAAQQTRIAKQINARIATVLAHGRYIMGPEVEEFESALAEFCGAPHVVSCSSGTDALLLGLIALDVKHGDGVIVPSFSFAASAEILPRMGAIPVFADINPATFNLDANKLDEAVDAAKKHNITVKGIIPVGMFGQPADMDAITAFAAANNLWVMDDAAQSFGGTWGDKITGSPGWASLTATSFFPAKPLGCYGDGGAVFCDDADMAAIMRSARFHGQSSTPYEYDRLGMTARLDTMQAAILMEKLAIFSEELAMRNAVAARYHDGLRDIVTTPALAQNATSSWAQYTIKLPANADRGAVQARLKDQGIPTAIYYPKGIHEHAPYKDFPRASLTATAEVCPSVLALPMHPYLAPETQTRIITALKAAIG